MNSHARALRFIDCSHCSQRENNDISPVTMNQLSINDLRPNGALKELIMKHMNKVMISVKREKNDMEK